MIELTQLNGTQFTLNSDLIESIENIPETKVLLTSGKYFLVEETRGEIVEMVVAFRQWVFQGLLDPRKGPLASRRESPEGTEPPEQSGGSQTT